VSADSASKGRRLVPGTNLRLEPGSG
jgi:hypothetical protein